MTLALTRSFVIGQRLLSSGCFVIRQRLLSSGCCVVLRWLRTTATATATRRCFVILDGGLSPPARLLIEEI